MLELKTKRELAQAAATLATSVGLVRYNSQLYAPASFTTGDSGPADPEDQIWQRLLDEDVRDVAGTAYDILFPSDSELRSFIFMVEQFSAQIRTAPTGVLLNSGNRLQWLSPTGELQQPNGSFVSNAILIPANATFKDPVFEVLSNWLDGEDEAHSLLYHIATVLAPQWSAGKYVILLGEGSNGKSVFMKMLEKLFGSFNVSHVKRQDIAQDKPTVLELNGSLINLVYDGPAEFIKDSGQEKSLIVGEPVPVRRLYSSSSTTVQTTALFIEGLNNEPKSRDKSYALQRRLVRFQFPNTYTEDSEFEKRMLSTEYLGGLLTLLLEHFVKQNELSTKLAPTTRTRRLQLEHEYVNSLGIQFIDDLDRADDIDSIIGVDLDQVIDRFRSWRLRNNDLGEWSRPDVLKQISSLFEKKRSSRRINGSTNAISYYKVEGLSRLAQDFIAIRKEQSNAATTEPRLVED